MGFKRYINLFVMDVDGTLTDGKIIIDSLGHETKQFDVKDGMGIKLLHDAGIKTAIISARYSEAVNVRARELSIDIVEQGVSEKYKALKVILNRLNIPQEEVAYVGDDLNDILICENVGISFAVNDAAEELKKKVDITLKKNGGNGAIREAAEFILNNYLEAGGKSE